MHDDQLKPWVVLAAVQVLVLGDLVYLWDRMIHFI